MNSDFFRNSDYIERHFALGKTQIYLVSRSFFCIFANSNTNPFIIKAHEYQEKYSMPYGIRDDA